VQLLQVVVPSREGIPAYDQLKLDIEGLVGEINGRFSRPGWIPIQYRYRSLDPNELLVHYRLADAAVVTPLEDGMNVVAKEYCAANVDGTGVLVLSRFAGAAAQLGDGAVLVNPWDEVGFAESLHRALTLESEERRQRMERLRATVRNEDVYHWAGSFLKAAMKALPGDELSAALPH
jgi:trehalose 6-phosphate synthase